MAKTEITIETKDSEIFKLEENVGLVKGAFKVIAPVNYGIGSLLSSRTGDLII